MASMQDELLKVGELARRSGVSVRTLHHYDELGLLVPSFTTAAGHRQYTAPTPCACRRCGR